MTKTAIGRPDFALSTHFILHSQFAQLNRVILVTNSFGRTASIDAILTRTSTPPTFVYLPISQTVVEGDTVTFSALAVGSEPITYQWQVFTNGAFTNLPGQTSRQYVDVNMQHGDEGTYAVVVSNSVGTNTFTNAVLTDAGDYNISDLTVMPVFGPRQDYTFQAYKTYYIAYNVFTSSPSVDLYGTTTIQGGAVIKFDYDELPYLESLPNVATLVLHGTLVCATAPYNPAILTSVDDDSQGELPWVYWYHSPYAQENQDCSSSDPVTAANGCAYLNLDDVHSSNVTSISNLRFCYADLAVTTPTNSGVLEVWNCQFLACHLALNSRLTNGGSTNSLHNALFSLCGSVISALTNSAELDGEQVTADAGSFWFPELPPGKVCLTNSIVLGEFGTGPVINNQKVIINPDT